MLNRICTASLFLTRGRLQSSKLGSPLSKKSKQHENRVAVPRRRERIAHRPRAARNPSDIGVTALILTAAALLIFAAWCVAHHFALERKRPGLPRYETYGDVIELPRHEGNIVRFPKPSKGTHFRAGSR